MSRRLASRAGRLFIAMALTTAGVAVGSHLGVWQAITGNSEAAWNWVERFSWFSALASLILTIVYERRARQGGEPSGGGHRILAVGWNRIEVAGDRPGRPEPVIPARAVEPDMPVNHLPERATLETELAGPRSGVVLVYGPAGAGKTTLVEGVLRDTDLGVTRERYDLVADESFGAAELVRILSKNIARSEQGLRDDPLQSLQVALESRTDPGVAVVIDGAQRVLEPITNKVSDFDLNETLAVVAARQERRVKIILITREQPMAAASSRWTTDDAVHILVNRLAPEDFKQYLAILDPEDAKGMQADYEDLCDLLQGMPRNANLFWAALTLSADRPSTRELTRRLERPRRQDRPSALARMVVDSLTLEQSGLVAAVAAYDLPVLSEDVRRLLGDEASPVRVEEQLDELAKHHVIVRLAAPPRYCLMDPEILDVLERDGDQNMETLRRKAANLLSDRRKPSAQVRGPGHLTVEFAELRITLKNRDWLAAFDRIQALDEHLVKWSASGLVMDARTRVIGRLEDDFDELRNFNALGYARASRGLQGQAIEAYEKALALAETQDRPDELRRKILTNIADLEWQRSRIPEAERRYQEVLDLAMRDGDDDSRMAALSGIADCRRRHGDHLEAVTRGRAALSLAQARKAHRWEIDISVKVARWLSEQKQPAEAWRLMAEAAAVAGKSTDLVLRARCLDGEADLHLDDGDWVAARNSAAKARQQALDIHDPVTVLQARTTLAMAALRLGDLETARAEIDHAAWYRREKRSLIVLALQALIAFRQDSGGEARTLFETLESEAVQRRKDDPDDFAAWDLEAIAICGLGADRPGQAAAAKTAFGKARAIAPDFPVVKERLRFMLSIVAASSSSYGELIAAATGSAVRGSTQ